MKYLLDESMSSLNKVFLNIDYKGKDIKTAADFSTQTVKVRRNWSEMFQAKKKKKKKVGGTTQLPPHTITISKTILQN